MAIKFNPTGSPAFEDVPHDRPKVLIEVYGGCASSTYSIPGTGKPEVAILDWDCVRESPDGEYTTPDMWVLRYLFEHPNQWGWNQVCLACNLRPDRLPGGPKYGSIQHMKA